MNEKIIKGLSVVAATMGLSIDASAYSEENMKNASELFEKWHEIEISSSRNAESPSLSSRSLSAVKREGQESDTASFGGLDWGVGVSLTLDTGNNDRVASASVVNGIVRVEDQNNAPARIMLEAHYFFTPNGGFPLTGLYNQRKGGACSPDKVEIASECDKGTGKFNKTRAEWGWGPFVALQPGSDDIIDAIAAGLMVGFKRSNDPNDDASWNFGVGVVVDPNTQILGEGLIANQALPDGETEIRFREEEQVGILFLFSTKF